MTEIGPQNVVDVPDGDPADPLHGGEQRLNAEPAGAPDADVVLARHVLTAVAERRRLAS